jgi:hypothetical protein
MRTLFHHAVSAIAVAAFAAIAASPAHAARQASGVFQGVEWQAQSTLVGVTPTGGTTGGDRSTSRPFLSTAASLDC